MLMSGLFFSRVSVMQIISGKTVNCEIKLIMSSKFFCKDRMFIHQSFFCKDRMFIHQSFFVKIECLYVKEKVHWNLTLELKTVCHSRSVSTTL